MKQALSRGLVPAGIIMLVLGALALGSVRTPSTGWGPLLNAEAAQWQAGIDAINQRYRANVVAVQAMNASDAGAVGDALGNISGNVQKELNAHNLQHAQRVAALQHNILMSQVLLVAGYSLLMLATVALLPKLV